MYVNVSRWDSEEESAELEDDRKTEMAEKQMQTAFVPEIFSRPWLQNCNLLQTAIANTVLVPPESTVNRVAQTQLVTHRLRIRSSSLVYCLSVQISPILMNN